MAFSFNEAFGLQPQALALRGKRMQIIASNLANADTPGYLARDLDFRDVMQQQQSTHRVYRTHVRHIDMGPATNGQGELKYRVPLQPSADGNTVDPQFEQTAFADNSIRFQASLMFLDSRIRGLKDAISGGQG